LEKNITSDAGHKISYEYEYDYLGNMLSYTAPGGAVSSYEYDYAGNQVSFVDGEGNTFENGYDEVGRMIWSQDAEGNRVTYYYDASGMNIKTVSPFDNSSTSTVKMYYDLSGNLIKKSVQSNTAGEADSYTDTEYIYDCMNRVSASVSYPDDTTPVYTQYFYDNNGNTQHFVSGLTELLQSSADIQSSQPAHTYSYDELNRMISHTNPSGDTETYTYDRVGNLLVKEDMNGTKLAYIYDHDGNVTSISTVNAADGIVSSTVSMAYNIFGLPSSKTVNGVTTNYTYDAFGRQLTETSGDVEKTYTYDDNSNILSVDITDYDGSIYSMNYTYDNLNRIVTATNPVVSASFAYTPSGRMSSSSVGTLTTEYGYNDANMLLSAVNKLEGNSLSSYNYTYYLDGNQRTVTDSHNGTTQYAYDGMGRLTSETNNNYSINYGYDNFGNRAYSRLNRDGDDVLVDYTYDINNRLIRMTESQGSEITETHCYYDNNGNLINKLKGIYSPLSNDTEESISLSVGSYPYADSFAYNAFGQLVSADIGGVVSSYTYNADGLRVGKTVGNSTTSFLWDGGYVVGEITSRGQSGEFRTNFIGPQGVFATQRDGMRGCIGYLETDYLVKNGHGDVTGVVHYNDMLEDAPPDVYRYQYDAFGNLLSHDDYTDISFRYCGEYFDEETGFIYLRNRYYDPSVGRFITEDPARDGLNWYTYCGNNPVMYHDPSGKAFETIFDIVSLGFSIADIVSNPTDIWAWAGFAGDIVDFIPFVTGVGESIKVIGSSEKIVAVANKADEVVDSLKILKATERATTIKDGAVVMSYKNLRKLTKGTELHAHHLIEKRFANTLGINADDILSIAIDKDTHQTITNAFKDRIARNTMFKKSGNIYTSTATAQDIWDATVDIYTEYNMTEYLAPLKEMLQGAGHSLNWKGW